MQSKIEKLREKFDALLLREIAVFGGIPVHKGRLGQETEELRAAIAEVLEAITTTGPQTTVLRYMVDPYATGTFKLVDLGLPTSLHDELMRLAIDKSISIYYLAAIYHEGRHAVASQIVQIIEPEAKGEHFCQCDGTAYCEQCMEPCHCKKSEPERKCAREGCNLAESEHGLQVGHFFERRG